MKRIGVLTSGGDAPGMNAAVRAVVRTGLSRGAAMFAIREGYRGMVNGDIGPVGWHDVGGILHKGGTVIGTARCAAFRERSGRLEAAAQLLQHEIDNLVVIGGDGSLAGAHLFAEQWPGLLQELCDNGRLPAEMAQQHPMLTVMGLVGSIDNDMCGTDITIGADSALRRITDAVDAITSTAASHQRSFVVEVMGRHCGYLALMSALATGSDWVLIPESPPNLDNWEDKMCDVLRHGREIGRRDSIVIIAEGAQDRRGNPITSAYVKQVLEERLQEDARVTILGHVQRGGAPSAFDRNLSTISGAAAVDGLYDETMRGKATMVGIRGNKITYSNLIDNINLTYEVNRAIEACDFDKAMSIRGGGFQEAFRTIRTLVRAKPHDIDPSRKQMRLAIMNAGAPAPGMNTAVRAAVRLALDKGHTVLGVHDGFQGLIKGDLFEMAWMSVNGWAPRGGAELGTNRHIPANSDFYKIARTIEANDINALLVIGGWSAYQAVLEIYNRRNEYPAFDIPIVCIPASIDNDLAGSELSVGADTALNNIVSAVDKIKQSAVASGRVFVVEVMGRQCGYLALMSAMASGAERVYLHEEGLTLKDLQKDVQTLIRGFENGKRLGLVIRSEGANDTYSTDFVCSLFKEEGRGLYTARQAILGHLQQGGDPTPFDRILAARLALKCVKFLEAQLEADTQDSACIGLLKGKFDFTELWDLPRQQEVAHGRPKYQWWLQLRPVARVMAQSGPEAT